MQTETIRFSNLGILRISWKVSISAYTGIGVSEVVISANCKIRSNYDCSLLENYQELQLLFIEKSANNNSI